MTSNDKKDLYAILELSKNASDEDIKKAYKKLALKYHPDRNPTNKDEANAKFLEVSNAYKILSNPESRSRYDRFGVIDGESGGDGGGPGFPSGPGFGFPGGGNPFDFFQNLFNGGAGGMPGMPNRMNEEEIRRTSKSPEKKVTINISLKDAYLGKSIPIDFIKKICCDKCNGLGAPNTNHIKSCATCEGKGKIVKIVQMGPMIQQSVQACYACGSKGKFIEKGYECTQCKGNKCISINRHLDCYVKPGSSSGTRITFKNESDWVEGFGGVGDFIVFLNVSNEENGFRREGDNLVMNKMISLLEALTNVEVMFNHLDNRVIKCCYDNIIKPGQKMVIEGEGMPHSNGDVGCGDLIIYFDVVFPTSLQKERSKYLGKILPHPKKSQQFEGINPNDIHVKEIKMVSGDGNSTSNSGNATNAGNSANREFMYMDDNELDDIFGSGNGDLPHNIKINECATQ